MHEGLVRCDIPAIVVFRGAGIQNDEALGLGEGIVLGCLSVQEPAPSAEVKLAWKVSFPAYRSGGDMDRRTARMIAGFVANFAGI